LSVRVRWWTGRDLNP